VIHHEGLVIAVERDGSELLVEVPQRTGACGNCSSKEGCQTGLLGLRSGNRHYRVPNRIGAVVGDRVSLSVADGTVASAAWFSYLVPALAAIGAAAIGQSWAGDAGAVSGLVIGLVLSTLMLRRRELQLRRDGEVLAASRPASIECASLEGNK
jgi:positive regulator of sigma E activity